MRIRCTAVPDEPSTDVDTIVADGTESDDTADVAVLGSVDAGTSGFSAGTVGDGSDTALVGTEVDTASVSTEVDTMVVGIISISSSGGSISRLKLCCTALGLGVGLGVLLA